MSFQWDQPYFSVSGAPGSSSDIDILLLNDACDTVLASGTVGNVGSDPIEIFSFTNPGPSTSFNLMIFDFSGPPPGLMKTLMAGPMRLTEYSTSSSTAYGHVNTNKVMAVGAAFYDSTPRFGVNPPVIESFSSRGGTPKLFDVAGRRLPAPQVPRQPGIVAPDGVDTSFFGRDSDRNGFPNFSGTSAAVPHAAGVAALIKSFRPSLTPRQIYSAMRSTAIDMSTSGFDFVSGFGLIDALAAISSVGQLPPGPSSPCLPPLDLCKGAWRAILQ
jgi:subtilisin family serine protease